MSAERLSRPNYRNPQELRAAHSRLLVFVVGSRVARSPKFDFKSCPPHDCVCHRLEWEDRGWTVRSLPGPRIWNNESKVELTACFPAARRSRRLRGGRGLSPWDGAKGSVRNETALKFDEISAGSLAKNTAFEKHYRIGDLARLWVAGDFVTLAQQKGRPWSPRQA